MRFNELLTEYNSSPSNLINLASQIDARVGIEFEMIVPGILKKLVKERDSDADVYCTSIDQIVDFFDHDQINSPHDLRYLRTSLETNFREYLENKADKNWDKEEDIVLHKYAEEQTGEDEECEELYNDLLRGKSREFFNIKEDWIQEWILDNKYSLESDWLDDAGYVTMEEVNREHDIDWPYFLEVNSGGDLDLDDLADEIEYVIQNKVSVNNEYHNQTKRLDSWYLEPDESIIPSGNDSTGLEFVSPPMPFLEMVVSINKIISWATSNNYYTNKSTGLHVNVSIKNGKLLNIDYVKLVLLLGDNYILDKFGRGANSYCRPALGKINAAIKLHPEMIRNYLMQMKQQLNNFSMKLITTTDKYTSINLKSGYVEFRSPGGNWLKEDITVLQSTIARFIVALDAACDPTKYQKEYATKLYKLIQGSTPTDENSDTISYFSQYAAGKLSKEELVSIIKQIQSNRNYTKYKPTIES